MEEQSKWTIIHQPPQKKAFWGTAFLILSLILMSSLHWILSDKNLSPLLADKNIFEEPLQIYRLFTSLFIHADIGHLFSNLILFIFLSYFIIGYFGFSVLIFGGILAGGLTNLIILSSPNAPSAILGASGWVYWLGGFWLLMYLMLDTQRTWYQRSLRTIGVSLALFVPSSTFDPSVSYESHAWGFLFGVLCGLLFYLFRKETFIIPNPALTIIQDDHSYLEINNLE